MKRNAKKVQSGATVVGPVCALGRPASRRGITRLFGRALGLALAATALGSLRAAEWRLELRTGAQLVGELRSLDSVLRLYDPALRAERSFDLATLARLRQTGAAPTQAAGPLLTLRNGDRLAGTGVTLNAEGPLLLLAGADCLRLPREQLDMLQTRLVGGLDAVTSLDDLAEGDGGAPGWVRTATGLHARSRPASLARQGVLSERVRIVLEIPAVPPPDLWLYLFTDSTQPTGDSYALNLQGDSVSLERQYATGPTRLVGSARLPETDSPRRCLLLTADLARGRFRLETLAGLCADWTAAGIDPPTGQGLKLVCLQTPAELHDLTVTRLPSADIEVDATPSPTADRVFLENGDRLEGEILAITAASWTLRRGPTTALVQVPAAAVWLACFRAAAAGTVETGVGLDVRLRNGSRFRALSVRLESGRLRVRSGVWGEAEFALEALQEIRFAPP
jgi:hypothetical protein